MPDSPDWLGPAMDCLKDRGLDEAAGLLRSAASPPRVEIDGWVGFVLPDMATALEAWAGDPMPKLPGLVVSVVPHGGAVATLTGLNIFLRVGRGRRGAACEARQSLRFERAERLVTPASAGELTRLLDEVHRRLVGEVRRVVGGTTAAEMGSEGVCPENH